MATKKTTLFIAVGLFLFLSCDPPEQFCNDIGRSAYINDLYTLKPLQKIYQQGDEITYRMQIPSVNQYFGGVVNIYDETKDKKPYLYGDDDLFVGNKLTFQKGEQGAYPNQFYMEFNDGIYQLIFTIKLKRPGNYVFGTEQIIHFEGEGDCNFYNIDTYLFAEENNYELIFEVVE